MRLNLKTNQKNNTKYLLKKNNFLFFAIGSNQNSQNWIILEQSLHKLAFAYNKTYKNITTKILQESVIKKLKNIINSTFFFLKPKKKTIIKSNIIDTLSAIKFSVLAFKLNKKIYAIPQLKNQNSLHYKKNISIMYQFLITTCKPPTHLKQK